MRQDQWQVTLTVDGQPMGVWDTLAGGAVTAGETKYRPGGMAAQVSLGGAASVDNLTLGRLVTKPDWPTLRHLMTSRCGKARCTAARQPLDEDGNPFGDPLVYSGTLLTVTPGDVDSNADGAQVWTLVVSTDGHVA